MNTYAAATVILQLSHQATCFAGDPFPTALPRLNCKRLCSTKVHNPRSDHQLCAEVPGQHGLPRGVCLRNDILDEYSMSDVDVHQCYLTFLALLPLELANKTVITPSGTRA